MCTGSGFSQLHHNGVGSFNAWSMTTPFLQRVSREGKLLAGDGGEDESAG
jgi:hypothetical protein